MNRNPARLFCAAALLAALMLISADRMIGADTATTRVSFNKGWLFARFGPMPDSSTLKEPSGLEAPQASDAGWRSLDLPHDWGIEGPFRMDLPCNTGKLPWEGIGWYRKHFSVPASEKGRQYFIDIDGAMSHAKVWLNGEYLGEWPYGYASFRLEMTPHIKFGEENLLAVRLDNPPNSSRWYPGGGIYRNVWLVATDPVHIAHGGAFVAADYKDGRSNVRITTEVQNQGKELAGVEVAVQITEFGKTALVCPAPDARISVAPGGTTRCVLQTRIPAPRVWEPRSPNLYTAIITLRHNNELADSVRIPFGVRSVQFTPDNGLLLNGRRVPVNGVCNHHDLGLIGAAVNTRALERQIRLLQEMGCNAIRTSHNPPAPELLDLCDRMGMMVMDEAFDCWVEGKTPNDYSTLFRQWHEKDIRAMVRRDRNHPSVIAWSAGNEIAEQKDSMLVSQLAAIFHSEDPTRPVTAGCNNWKAGFNGFQKGVDVMGYNYMWQHYASFHQANPAKPLWGSETASCVSTFGEYFFPVEKDKSKGWRKNQVSSYDLYAPSWAIMPDTEFAAQDRNPFVAGEFVWTGFDYLGEPTPFGDDPSVSRSSYFGIMDLCGFKKDRFYLYQSRWKPEMPMAHILPHWNWPDRVGQVTPVHVYTSGDEGELFLNGRSLGRKVKGQLEYRLVWDSVRYTPGELKVVTYKKGKQWATNVMRTTGAAEKIVLTTDRTALSADGRDLAFVTVSILDKDGLRVPTARDLVRFKVNGAGVIAASGNGDPTDHRVFHSTEYNAFHGLCMLIVRSVEGKSGPIQVSAEADGLAGGNIDLRSE